MNFYTPERMPHESFASYKRRQKEQKFYMKRGCLIFSSAVRLSDGRFVSRTYRKPTEN
jgi:hypothetical protein